MEKKQRILVIDDEALVRRSVQRILGDRYEVREAALGSDGIEALLKEPFDLALVDLKLTDMDGMDILRQAPDRFPDVPIVIITGYSSVRNAVEAIKAGAMDYVAKPFTPEELEAAVEKTLRARRWLRDVREMQEALADRYQVARLIGDSEGMKRVLSLIRHVAPTGSTVLVSGESGTGKELVARAIHFSSPRREERFVAVDCGAISPTLIASELFGHVRGSFTGAVEDREGLIRAADRGTLFLDEIGNLPSDLQATLLRVIETGEVKPVGSSDTSPVDVRIVAATNSDLQAMIRQGTFREDLFYRLNVFPIVIPPLRERPEDIELLSRHFLSAFASKMHKEIEDFTPEAMQALQSYAWPGNVRELSNVVERLVILSHGSRVGEAHVRQTLSAAVFSGAAPKTVDELNASRKTLREHAVLEAEKSFLLDALKRNNYNASRAAEETKMQRPNFQALLKKHNLRIRDLKSERGGENEED